MDKIQDHHYKAEKKWRTWKIFGLSHSQCLLVLLCFLAANCIYIERVAFSVAYTSMARAANVNEAEKGVVLSTFYWGYAISQIPGAAAAQKYGGSLVLLISFTLWSVASILTPSKVDNYTLIKIARICVGLSQGVTIPAIHTLLSQNIPPNERAMATSLTTSGLYLGSALAITVIPTIAKLYGSGFVFKVMGILGLAWSLLWTSLNKYITSKTKKYELPKTFSDKHGSSKEKNVRLPWTVILRSMSIWSLVFNNFSFHYSVYVVMNWLPTYFNSLVKADLSSIGNIKGIPYLAIFFMSNFGSWLGDWFIKSLKVSVGTGRKLVNSIGFGSATLFLMCMPFSQGIFSGISLTTMVMASLGLARGGFSVNHMDIAPKYAGLIMGISNTAGTISGIAGVAITGYLLDAFGGSGNVAGWICSFTICSILSIVGILLFVAFGKGKNIFD